MPTLINPCSRVMATDLEVLQLAQDALATSTLGTGQSLAVDLQRAAVNSTVPWSGREQRSR